MPAGTEHDTNLRRHKIDCLNTERDITLQREAILPNELTTTACRNMARLLWPPAS